jgi:hypothetical protein
LLKSNILRCKKRRLKLISNQSSKFKPSQLILTLEKLPRPHSHSEEMQVKMTDSDQDLPTISEVELTSNNLLRILQSNLMSSTISPASQLNLQFPSETTTRVLRNLLEESSNLNRSSQRSRSSRPVTSLNRMRVRTLGAKSNSESNCRK